MHPRWLAVLLLAGVVATPLGVQSAEGILVWRLQAKTGVSDADIDSLSGYLAAEVERHSGAKITSQADIETILEGEQQKIGAGRGPAMRAWPRSAVPWASPRRSRGISVMSATSGS